MGKRAISVRVDDADLQKLEKEARKRGVSTAVTLRERIKDRLRTADEINRIQYRPPRKAPARTSWTIEAIRAAVDAQMRGDFREAVKLAEAMRRDDAMFTAYHNRIAPQFAIASELQAAPGARGENTKRKALSSCFVARSVLASIHGTLANHGIAIGYIEQETNEDGTRVDFKLTEWPLEHVRYNESTEQLETQTREGMNEPIVHGDGRWVVFRKFHVTPWKQEACVLPGGMIWGAHQYGLVDWAAAARSHGRARVVGELPEGVTLNDANGNLTTDAASMLNMLIDLLEGEASAGLRTFGSKTDFVANGSSAWQVFSELITNREKAAARVYLGTDAILGSIGGAPGVDIEALFKVAGTKVQGDLQAIVDGLRTGLYEPWCALNEGDSRNAPTLVYLVPDPDLESKIEKEDQRLQKFFAAIEQYKKHSMSIDQDVINALASKYRVPAPMLAPATTRSVPLDLAPTDKAKVVRVDEVRGSLGLPGVGGERGSQFIAELDAQPATPPGATPATEPTE